eukprot:670587-Prorocentrum_minimum.AAC.4
MKTLLCLGASGVALVPTMGTRLVSLPRHVSTILPSLVPVGCSLVSSEHLLSSVKIAVWGR